MASLQLVPVRFIPLRLVALGIVSVLLLGMFGCGSQPAVKQSAANQSAESQAPVAKKKKAKGTASAPAAKKPASEAVADTEPSRPFLSPEALAGAAAADDNQPAKPRPAGSLADLVERGKAAEFALPQVDEGKIAAAGIRKLTGKHLILYTDVPETVAEVQQLPAIFDLAVAEMAKYFQVDPAKLNDWKLVGCLMESKPRFQGAGLYTVDLPDFPNGFHKGSQIWWFDQPSDYYRRHLMIHEGVHAFMSQWTGGAGPPWYSEGMAELLGTHEWDGQHLKLGYNPPDKTLVPYWGRVKIVRDEFAANRGLTLVDVFRFDGQAHLKNEAYGWCWAATSFLSQHPRTRDAFHQLPAKAGDRSIEFSKQFVEQLKAHWPEIAEDWQLYVMQLDYGYDLERAAVLRKPAVPLPAAGASVTVTAERGWQATGFEVEAGKTYEITGRGRYQLAREPAPWWCEPGGITLEYHQGKPLGMLLAAVGNSSGTDGTLSPLASPDAIGLSARITPRQSGPLYLLLNDSPARLADNSGEAQVKIREIKP
jgi:hypothetical protein